MRRGAHLNQHQVELVDVGFLGPHPGLVRRHIDDRLHDEVSDTYITMDGEPKRLAIRTC